MNNSSIITRVRYQACVDLKYQTAKAISYIGDKKKVDSTSIDEFNIIQDYSSFSDIDSYLKEKKEQFIWSMDGDIDAKAGLKNLDTDASGYLWSLVISFDEDFALNNGLITKIDYYNLTKSILPYFFVSSGFDLNNLSWYCAKHDNTAHPHLHIIFFEHHKKMTSPNISQSALYGLRSSIANYLVDNKKFYLLRDETYKNIIGDIDLKELTKIRKQRLFSDKFRKDLNNKLSDFYKTLPKTGRLQYNSKNMLPYKEELNKIIEYILLHDSVKYSYAKYLNILKQHQQELESVYGKSKYRNYYENQLNKLYSKIGNEILQNFKIYISKDKTQKELDFLKKHIIEMDFKSKKYAKEETIVNIGKELYKLCIEANLNSQEIKKIFQKWIIKSNYDFDINYILGVCKTKDTEISSSDYYKILKKLGYNYDRYKKYKNKNFYKELDYKIMLNRAFMHLYFDLEQQEKMIQNQIEYDLEKNI